MAGPAAAGCSLVAERILVALLELVSTPCSIVDLFFAVIVNAAAGQAEPSSSFSLADPWYPFARSVLRPSYAPQLQVEADGGQRTEDHFELLFLSPFPPQLNLALG